jgi:SNF2 family DNA or RNA helicase
MSVYEKLYPYQRKAVDHFVRQDPLQHALLADTGIGKTWIAAGVIENYINRCILPLDFLLVVHRANLESTWLRVLSEIGPTKVCTYTEWDTFKSCRRSRVPRVLIITYRMVHYSIKSLARHPWRLITYDEAHTLKDRSSVCSRDSSKFKSHGNRLILTGTPIEQKPIDLFAQFRFVAPHVLGKWGDFSKMYCRKGGYMGHVWEFRWQRLPRFKRTISPYIYQIRKKNVLRLPPMKIVSVKVHLLGKQREIYDKLEKEMVGTLNGSTIQSDLTVTNLIRLQQITGGFVRTDKVISTRTTSRGEIIPTYELATTGGNAKLRKTVAILRKVSPPVVVFCRFLEEIRILQQALDSRSIGTLTGATADRGNVVTGFQKGLTDILLCQIRTGGVGIDLFASHTAVIYSSSWSSIDHHQAISRLNRIGQNSPVTIYWLQAIDTIDEAIYRAIRNKQTNIKKILSTIKVRHEKT